MKIHLRIMAAVMLGVAGGANATDFDFDGGSAVLADLVGELKAESGALEAPVASTGAGTSSELAHFWEDLKKDVFDDACESAEIELNENGKLLNVLGIEGGFKRHLNKFPNEKVALIDEVGVKFSMLFANEALHLTDTQGLAVSLSGALEGKSQVVRPLENDRYCRELGTLLKLYQVKTVLPSKAERIAEMKNGEIWKLPLVLRLGFAAGSGTAVNEVLNISISAGTSRERKPSVTLYRMDDNNLRLRLRLDRIEARSAAVSLSSVEIPMADIGLWNAEHRIAELVNRRWAREINEYVALKLSYGHSRFTGKKLLLEFMLNPRDPAQMASLEKFLNGDFGILKRFIEMGLRFNNFSETDASAGGAGEIEEISQQTGQALAANSSFAGSNLYHGHSANFHAQVPVLHMHDSNWSSSYNRYQSLAKGGETLHVQQETRNSDNSSINIPFVGKVVKYDSQKNVYVINKEATSGQITRPVMMYQQYEGFVKQGDGPARAMLEKANGMLRYVGGDGAGQGNLIPVDAIFPAAAGSPAAEFGGAQTGKIYDAALMSFKLLINEGGVQGIIFAPAQAIMKAYMNIMREVEAEIIAKVADLFVISEAGTVEYDQNAVSRRLAPTTLSGYQNGTNPLEVVRTLAYTATCLIQDLASVREAGNWKEQSEKLAKVSAGSSKSGLKYEDFFKVVLQLVAPSNVSAEVYVHTDKRVQDEADVDQTYQFFNTRDNNFDTTLSEVGQMRERFADPAELTD